MANINEENLEGIGYRNAQNLGKKIAKAMNNKTYQAKKNARLNSIQQTKSSPRVANTSSGGSLSIPNNHRIRRYFGVRAPGASY